MKKDLLTPFVALEKEELQQLCCVVNETLAKGIELPEKKEKRKSYGINDLWSLRRNMRSAGRNWNSRARNFIVRG
jgi:hypothetical protein